MEEAWVIPQMFIQTLFLKPVVTYYMYTEIACTKYQHIVCHYALGVIQPGCKILM